MDTVQYIIREILDPISIVVGVLIIFPVVATWWEIWVGRRRRHSRWFEEVRQSAGTRPALLIVDLLEGREILTNVIKYKNTNEHIKDIPKDRVFEINHSKRIMLGDMPTLAREIREKAAEIVRAGADTVHLFYAGPLVPLALIGAEFSNITEVMLYQHNPAGYENWGPLKHRFD